MIGVDGDPKIIEIAKSKSRDANVRVKFDQAMATKLPYANASFDRVLSTLFFHHIVLDAKSIALCELHRVLKPQAKMVLDIPNPDHPHVNTMLKLEKYLGRPNVLKPRSSFEHMLLSFFVIDHADDSRVMIKYFLRTSR